MRDEYEQLSKNAKYSEKSLRTEWEKSDSKINEQQTKIDKLMSEIKLAKDQVKEANTQQQEATESNDRLREKINTITKQVGDGGVQQISTENYEELEILRKKNSELTSENDKLKG